MAFVIFFFAQRDRLVQDNHMEIFAGIKYEMVKGCEFDSKDGIMA